MDRVGRSKIVMSASQVELVTNLTPCSGKNGVAKKVSAGPFKTIFIKLLCDYMEKNIAEIQLTDAPSFNMPLFVILHFLARKFSIFFALNLLTFGLKFLVEKSPLKLKITKI